MNSLTQLQQWVDAGRRMVFFGGAGVSTESGIPDFRSVDGLYSQRYDHPPETILSHSFFLRHPDVFYDFYRSRMLYPDARPNAAHLKLSELEQAGRLAAVVTQNIDGLHQAAGSKTVFELHGSVLRNTCMSCGQSHPLAAMTDGEGLPRCACGGLLRPDVVLYEESLDEAVVQGAVTALSQADVVIVGGTSLAVYPAAGLLRYYRGDRLVLINRTATPLDATAKLVIHGDVGATLGQLRL